jgi:glycosyltransferase involved in cell wall biosynthesis
LSAPCPSTAVLSRERPQEATWLQLVSHLDPKFGGIASLLPMFCAASDPEGVRCPVLGFCEPGERNIAWANSNVTVTCVPANRVAWALDLRRRRRLKQAMRDADGVHIHGIWETHCAVGAKLAQSCRTPYVLSAHGMLERWALQSKRLKKALYATLVETDNLRRASCLRALTHSEVNDYRRIGLTNSIAVVPSGVAVPASASSDAFLESYPHLHGKRPVLFLGRLHAKKGLSLLLRAWKRAAREDSHLVIAGPDFDGTRSGLEKLAEELEISEQVTFAGMLSGPMKWSALAAARLFVLPSYSEGFSVAVLEALGMGVPVIVSRACNIPEVGEHGCGWVVEPEEAAISNALEEALLTSTADLRSMGDSGRALMASRYSWPVVGKQMAQVYRWVAGGPPPTDVPIFKMGR